MCATVCAGADEERESFPVVKVSKKACREREYMTMLSRGRGVRKKKGGKC